MGAVIEFDYSGLIRSPSHFHHANRAILVAEKRKRPDLGRSSHDSAPHAKAISAPGIRGAIHAEASGLVVHRRHIDATLHVRVAEVAAREAGAAVELAEENRRIPSVLESHLLPRFPFILHPHLLVIFRQRLAQRGRHPQLWLRPT